MSQSHCSAEATMPIDLTEATIRTARLYATGHNTDGIALSGAVSLAHSVIKSMLVAKCKLLAAAVFFVVVAISLVVGLATVRASRSRRHGDSADS